MRTNSGTASAPRGDESNVTNGSSVKLDEYDRELIRLLQKDGRASYQEMADATGLSPATVRRRVDQLIDAKLITISAVPNWSRLGLNFSAFVGISVDLSRLEHVARELSKMDEFYWIAMTTGDYDLLAEVFFPSDAEVATFVTDRIAHIEGIRSFRLFVSLQIFKSWSEFKIPTIE
jgi:Lrp/AsnC family transcriptional regulator for asnA, asnC and gidA